jgi:NADH-quinone oxidoreductase subunit L
MTSLLLITKWIVSLELSLFLLWSVFLGATTLLGFKFGERFLRGTMTILGWVGLCLSLLLVVLVLALHWNGLTELHQAILDLSWFQVGEFRYEVSLLLTFPASAYSALSSFVFICIATFSGNYLHRDTHYQRFMMLVAFAQMGVLLVCFATSGDVTFFGWELVGICSVMLIVFFQNHAMSAKQSLRAMINYRFADAFLIFAMLLMHYHYGRSDFTPLAILSPDKYPIDYWIGALLILGSLGKAGQFPFHTWLARAMEGPTPSSALFYGALSSHLGPLLLIKTQAYWTWSWQLQLLIGGVGLTTAILCRLIGSTTSNVKGQLAYAVMSQIGLIYIELSLELMWLALVHMLGHALLRTWQYLRSSALLRDVHEHKAVYDLVRVRTARVIPAPMAHWNRIVYVSAVQGFHFDELYRALLVGPILKLSRLLNFEQVSR